MGTPQIFPNTNFRLKKIMKCSHCGLVNFKTAFVCKRCNEPFTNDNAPANNVNSKVWKDLNFLVLEENANLPQFCMKCNSRTDTTNKTISIGYYPKHNLFLLLFGFLSYKTFNVDVILCQKHLSNRGNVFIVSILMIIAGVVSFIFGYLYFTSMPLVGGVLLSAIGCILMVIGGNPFAIEKTEDSKIWLKGVDKNYLASLPLLKNR